MTERETPATKGLLRDVIVSVFLGAGLFGLIVAVAGPLIVDWIRAGVDAEGIEGFWLPIGRIAVAVVLAGTAVALIVLAAISVVSKRWRARIWQRPIVWLAGLRVVTLAQRNKARKAAEWRGFRKAGEVSKPVVAAANARTVELEQRLERRDLDLLEKQQEISHLQSKLGELAKAEEDRRVSASTAPAASHASLPLPEPRWHVAPDNVPETDRYAIQNMVPRSVAREVRIESDVDMNSIDAGHWEDLSTDGPEFGLGTFTAVATQRGINHGVQIYISWYDESGVRKVDAKTVWPKPF